MVKYRAACPELVESDGGRCIAERERQASSHVVPDVIRRPRTSPSDSAAAHGEIRARDMWMNAVGVIDEAGLKWYSSRV